MSEKLNTAGLPPCFRLKPIKAAKVSEISEAVASSAAAPEERVNFHIGNPVNDPQLLKLYQETVFQGREDEFDEEKIDLIRKAIRENIPYSPRGGFKSKEPNSLAVLVKELLGEKQEEPLDYNLGQTSGKREIIFQSGGIYESLRVFLHAISSYLINLPAQVITWGIEIPPYLQDRKGLEFLCLKEEPDKFLGKLESVLDGSGEKPVFLILGNLLPEAERRELRRICLRSNLFILEVNDAPNNLSIARESGLLEGVIRFLQPAALDPALENLSLVIVAGNSDYLKVFEVVHFELKGTPAAAEMLLTAFLIQHQKQEQRSCATAPVAAENSLDNDPLDHYAGKLARKAEVMIENCQEQLSCLTKKNGDTIANLNNKISSLRNNWFSDPFQNLTANELTEDFFSSFTSPSFAADLNQAFISSFCQVHPEYLPESSFVVSGSARTALSLMGFNCGIREVITPDLGWTYHHCFQRVITVPLGEGLALDKEAVLAAVKQKIEKEAGWKSRGAVILNSPHNASGMIYSATELKSLLKVLLGQRVMVIDDLSYENIHPRADLNGDKTLRQLVDELVQRGQLKPEHGNYLITVHSLSKTDCFAGGRLAVVEIRLKNLRDKFEKIQQRIVPNIFSLFIAYLFYRNGLEQVRRFWLLRNSVFEKRMKALEEAAAEFPRERNPYQLSIVAPLGSMYPRLEINRLPSGLSLEWLSTNLAARGIGLVPLSTFSRTEKGYELARKSFRLSLGGDDSHTVLKKKMRKTLIDLNRLIASESAQYNSHYLSDNSRKQAADYSHLLNDIRERLLRAAEGQWLKERSVLQQFSSREMWQEHLHQRIQGILCRLEERLILRNQVLTQIRNRGADFMIERLEVELYRDSFTSRENSFRKRLYDRTVHPTQMYSLEVDKTVSEIEEQLFLHCDFNNELLQSLGGKLLKEFTGSSVAITSQQEADEVICDLNSMINGEEWAYWMAGKQLPSLLSFWGDWDGSTRPSGQGHRLVAAVIQENITEMSELVETMVSLSREAKFSESLLTEIGSFRRERKLFRKLLDDITDLTHVLEKRFQGLLPYDLQPGIFRRFGMVLKLSSDPVSSVLEHNDRLEKRMKVLRERRRGQLDYFFSLNKRIRKELFQNIHLLGQLTSLPESIIRFASYRDKLKRFVLTPRIHQKTIEDLDSFTIDRTVENIVELNQLSGAYGNPGMVMALQVSMSTDPEALIRLDRKFISEKNRIQNNFQQSELPDVCLVPLFEEKEAVDNLENYLDRIWNYCQSTRDMDQSTASRFSGMICELFVAGSDLSQQLSQPAGAALYRQAKYTAVRWLASRGLAEQVRIKLGSGEPMQRQGGYYDISSGLNTFYQPGNQESQYCLREHLPESARKAMFYAKSPVCGIMAGGEFRTLQSNVSEKLRHISHSSRADVLHHLWISQRLSKEAMARASRTMINTRLNTGSREVRDLERMILGYDHPVSKRFVDLTSGYFRQILYGSREDLLGIHVISYFISRTTPALRDRPVVRPSRHSGLNKTRQVVDQLRSMVPLSENGSMLRAIGHNRAQTVVLGVTQLTTGLFRALTEIQREFPNREEGRMIISERVLPMLPVKEILQSLRLFHDQKLSLVSEMEDLFPSGSSAFHLLREDNVAASRFISLIQQELVRRQGLKPGDFFTGENFRQELLPLFRPDLAILLQEDLYNCDPEVLKKGLRGPVNLIWLQEMQGRLEIPLRIKHLRQKIWELIRAPLREQVRSFVKVASAVSLLTRERDATGEGAALPQPAVQELTSSIRKSLKNEKDESLQQFLSAAVNYLSGMAGHGGRMPVEVIRVLRDVKQILTIEGQALNKEEQELFNFYLLVIARLAGENG